MKSNKMQWDTVKDHVNTNAGNLGKKDSWLEALKNRYPVHTNTMGYLDSTGGTDADQEYWTTTSTIPGSDAIIPRSDAIQKLLDSYRRMSPFAGDPLGRAKEKNPTPKKKTSGEALEALKNCASRKKTNGEALEKLKEKKSEIPNLFNQEYYTTVLSSGVTAGQVMTNKYPPGNANISSCPF